MLSPATLERFWSYVNKTETCWIWTGCKSKSNTKNAKWYGHFTIGNKSYMAHRISYRLVKGPIPPKMVLDHVFPRCTNTLCVNPDHLEPVTSKENARRYFYQFDSCWRGHLFTIENTYRSPNGGRRQCRICRRMNGKRHRRRQERKRLLNAP